VTTLTFINSSCSAILIISRALPLPDLVLISSEQALHCQQPGSQHCLGREEGQQENQGIPEQFASTNNKIVEVYQKVLFGIHAAKIIQLAVCSKFT